MDLIDLAARIRRLEDERAILHTVHAYGHAIDYGDEDRWVDCFTKDGLFNISIRGQRADFCPRGERELRRFVNAHSRAPERWHKHFVVSPVVAIEGDAATCESYFALLYDHEEEALIRAFGRYRDQLVRESDSRWRFWERRAEIESIRTDLPPTRRVQPAQRARPR